MATKTMNCGSLNELASLSVSMEPKHSISGKEEMLNVTIRKNGKYRPSIRYVSVKRVTMNVIWGL